MLTARCREILSWYRSENPGILTNMARLLSHGKLGGTGRMVILPVDQGFEHGPGRSFAMNPPAYDPRYHFQLAMDAGLSGYAAPLGFLEAGAADFAGELPLILKANNHDVLHAEKDPVPAQTAGVEDALRLGCVGVGVTIYPGSDHRVAMYEQLRELTAEARAAGLMSVVWSYPRGGDLSKAGETAIDVGAYSAQIAAQLGAHIIKVKLPSDHLEQAAAKEVYQKNQVPISSLTDRVRHIIQSAFDGRRIVIFSGGEAKDDASILNEVRAIRDGGGFGSIMGRNAFQREKSQALKLLSEVIRVYSGELT
jgi:class I fructose-bisphosphate aldolase